MHEPKTVIGVRAGDAKVGVIAIGGEITSASEEALMTAYAEANRPAPAGLILDFGDMVYMNSSGIGLLVTLLIRANRQGQRIFAVGLNDHYRQIFELTRLDEAIRLCADEAQARAEIG